MATCGPEGGEPVQIAGVTDDLDITLADGRTILLAGIDLARPHGGSASDGPMALSRTKLQAWLVGRPAVLRALAPGADRWGRVPALLFADTESAVAQATAAQATAAQASAAPLSVAFALVDAGLARARPDPALHACWAAMLGAESAARDATLGLWADPYYAVRHPDDTESLAECMGTMTLVEGRVNRVREARTRVIIELGQPHGNFSLRLGRRQSFILSRLGLSEGQLAGLTLRARGFLDDRFGASIEVTDADQVQVIDADAARQEGTGAQSQ